MGVGRAPAFGFSAQFFVVITAFAQQSLYLLSFLIARRFVLDFIVPWNIDVGSI
jgi:hypothetical protein